MDSEIRLHPNLVFNFMDNCAMKDFLILSKDEKGEWMMCFRAFGDEGEKELMRKAAEWYMEMSMNAQKT